MPKPEINIVMTSGRLTIPGEGESIRVSDTVTENGLRGLIEVVIPKHPGYPERVLAAATMNRLQVAHLLDALSMLHNYLLEQE